MDRKELDLNLSREEVSMDDISQRLVHNKVCNVTVKRNKNKLENALAVIQELVKAGRLHAEGEIETIRTPERLKEYMDHCTQSGEYVLDVETTGLDIYNDILVGICLYTPGETSAYVPFNHTDLQNIRLEDLMSEGAMEMLSAIQNFDSEKYSSSFSTFLYAAISRHYNDLFTKAVSAKRNPGGFVRSYEQINSNSEYEDDEDSLGSSEFSVECEDYSMVEIRDLLSRLKLSDKERVVVNLLMAGNSKPDIARRLGVKTPSVHSYVKRIATKINLSGAYA